MDDGVGAGREFESGFAGVREGLIGFLRGHAIGGFEGIDGFEIGAGEDGGFGGVGRGALPEDFDGAGIGKVAVEEKKGGFAGLRIESAGDVDVADGAEAGSLESGGFDEEVEGGAAGEGETPTIRIVGGLAEDAGRAGHDGCDDVDELGEAGDFDAIGFADEGVDDAADEQGVFEVVDFFEEVRGGDALAVAVALAIPDVPFVEGEPERFFGAFVAADHIADGGDFVDLALHAEVESDEFGAVVVGFVGVVEITMEGNGVYIVVALFEDFAVPFEISGHERAAGAASDEFEGGVDVVHLAGGVLRFEAVLGGGHVADLPGAVHFVAETPVFDVVGIGDAVFAAEFAPAGALGLIAVFDEGGGLFGSAGAEIQAHKRLSADELAPGHEFVGAELIGVEGVPGFVEDGGAILLGADAVEPVVAGDEIAAGIANDGNRELANFVHYVFAEAVGVGEFGLRVVDAVVDAAAEVFQEGAEDFAIDRGDSATSVGVDLGGLVVACGEQLAEETLRRSELGARENSRAGGKLQEVAPRDMRHGLAPRWI